MEWEVWVGEEPKVGQSIHSDSKSVDIFLFPGASIVFFCALKKWAHHWILDSIMHSVRVAYTSIIHRAG